MLQCPTWAHLLLKRARAVLGVFERVDSVTKIRHTGVLAPPWSDTYELGAEYFRTEEAWASKTVRPIEDPHRAKHIQNGCPTKSVALQDSRVPTHRHSHVGPTSVADLSTRAACTYVIVIRQIDIEYQLSLHRLKRTRFDREVVLGGGRGVDTGEDMQEALWFRCCTNRRGRELKPLAIWPDYSTNATPSQMNMK